MNGLEFVWRRMSCEAHSASSKPLLSSGKSRPQTSHQTIVVSRLSSGAKIVFGINAWTPHNVNHLCHPEAHGDAAQRVSVEFADLGLGHQKLDRVARRHGHRHV